jgi:hypothetical protein
MRVDALLNMTYSHSSVSKTFDFFSTRLLFFHVAEKRPSVGQGQSNLARIENFGHAVQKDESLYTITRVTITEVIRLLPFA